MCGVTQVHARRDGREEGGESGGQEREPAGRREEMRWLHTNSDVVGQLVGVVNVLRLRRARLAQRMASTQRTDHTHHTRGTTTCSYTGTPPLFPCPPYSLTSSCIILPPLLQPLTRLSFFTLTCLLCIIYDISLTFSLLYFP